MNNTLLKPIPQAVLQRKLLLLNGNAHSPIPVKLDASNVLSEANFPEIRTIACLIAAQRWTDEMHSPDIFTEPADWFAARMLVLNIRRLEIAPHNLKTIKTAILRAKTFATQHKRPFRQPEIRIVLHQEDNGVCPIWVAE
ncbi:MAG: hypothetical protein J6M43_04590 [Neisseriaceae bacterium]|nr:hypothetical protein [Neisseriaceae bacterium]